LSEKALNLFAEKESTVALDLHLLGLNNVMKISPRIQFYLEKIPQTIKIVGFEMTKNLYKMS
jgi:hypothetical protein